MIGGDKVKKMFLSLLFLIGIISISNAGVGTDYRIWRSSEICTAQTWGIISTGSIVLHSVQVSSGSAGYSSFTFMNGTSTNPAMGVWHPITSTSTAYNVTTTGTKYDFDIRLSTGFVYTKTGESCINVEWDFWGNTFPAGHGGRGIK